MPCTKTSWHAVSFKSRGRGNGRIGLKEGSGSSFQLLLNRFRIIDNDIAEAKASGLLAVTRGTEGNITLSGEMDIDQARIQANPAIGIAVARQEGVDIGPGIAEGLLLIHCQAGDATG